MDHTEGAGLQRADRVDFDPRVRLEFRGTQLSSDGGLLVIRELDYERHATWGMSASGRLGLKSTLQPLPWASSSLGCEDGSA